MSTQKVPPASRRRRLPTDQRQGEIITTVLALAVEHGPDSITTQDIADRMGVTQGAIFRHFPNKQAIWLAVFAWVREALGTAVQRAMAKQSSPLAKLEAAFIAHVSFLAAHPGVPRVLFHELQYPDKSPVRREVKAMVGAYQTRLAALFDQARQAGELPAALSTSLAPLLFIGAVQGLVVQSALTGDTKGMTRRARPLFAMMLGGYQGTARR